MELTNQKKGDLKTAPYNPRKKLNKEKQKTKNIIIEFELDKTQRGDKYEYTKNRN